VPTYNLTSLDDPDINDWVTVNSSLAALVIDKAPKVTADTVYQMSIETTAGTFVGNKNVSLTVTNILPLIPVSAAQGAVGGACGGSALNSLITGGAPMLLWGVMNGLQMLIVLPLTGAFMPDSILEYIYGMDFSLFSFDFIPIKSAVVIEQIDKILHYDQEDEKFNSMGLESTSSLINNLQIMLMFTLIGLFNLCLLPFYLHYTKQES
jgi:hypothetical protein